MARPKLDQAFIRAATQHHQAGRLQEAERMYRQMLQDEPKNAGVLHMLGVLSAQTGKLDVAIDLVKRSIAIAPKQAEAHFNLGNALREKGQLGRAVACYQKAVELNPRYVAAYENLAIGLHNSGELEEAIAAHRQCVQLKPDSAEAQFKLGNAFWACGRTQEAIAAYREAIKKDPKHLLAHSNLLFAMQYDFATDAGAIFEEHQRWNQAHAKPLEAFQRPHARSAQRRAQIADGSARLRVGYVSSDLRNHPVGRFMRPLLAAHDRTAFEIFCYSNTPAGVAPDAVADQLRAHVDHWKSIAGMSDERAVQEIRQDGIDILVDLNMHSEGNRLLLFARKPAPIQLTYLAYCSTTGLEAIDYRFTDPILDPAGSDEGRYSEKSWRLPETYWCYQQSEEATPGVSDPPAATAGRITFGCLNNAMKLSEETISTWGSLLLAMPESQLLVHARFKAQRERIIKRLAELQVPQERCKFAGHVPESDYFQQYARIDIALDPFPYAGGATTCDALWMGVPVVTLVGETAVGRGGASILTYLGLPELVAQTREDYVRIAADLAADLPRLTRLRGALRERMRASPLMNAQRFAQHVEAAYRAMWQKWCDTHSEDGHLLRE